MVLSSSPLRIAVLVALTCLTGCDRKPNSHGASQVDNPGQEIDWAAVDRENQDRLLKRRPSDWPLPNYDCGPGRPQPDYLNFYTIDNRFPTYLRCNYSVKQRPYTRLEEPTWFAASLRQMRELGSGKFPPVEWIAVAISNTAEHKDASTFEQSFKVGAIFRAGDVFDRSRDIAALVARAELDRRPFMYDPQQPTPGEQQRWLIVERHAAKATSSPLGADHGNSLDGTLFNGKTGRK